MSTTADLICMNDEMEYHWVLVFNELADEHVRVYRLSSDLNALSCNFLSVVHTPTDMLARHMCCFVMVLTHT